MCQKRLLSLITTCSFCATRSWSRNQFDVSGAVRYRSCRITESLLHGAECGPRPAAQRAGKPPVGTAALPWNLTDELRVLLGQSSPWRDHPPTAGMVSNADVGPVTCSNGRYLPLQSQQATHNRRWNLHYLYGSLLATSGHRCLRSGRQVLTISGHP